METRANYVLVGLFTLGVLFAAFGFVYWFASASSSSNRQTVEVIFTGSVSGLSNGGNVVFNGLRVGEVKKISLLPDDPKSVVATIDVDANTPIRSDTMARLEYQGLTGAAQVALTGGAVGAAPLAYIPGHDHPVIRAQRSDIQDLVETARAIARKADDVLTGVDQVVRDNKEGVTATVQNIEKFSRSLGENSEGIDKFLGQVGAAAERVGPLAERLESLSKHLDEVVVAFDKEKVNQIVVNLQNFTATLSDNRDEVSSTMQDVAEISKKVREMTPKLERALTDANGVLQGIDRQKVANIVDNLDRVSATLAAKTQDVDQTITSAREITAKFNKSADKIDGLIVSAQSFLGSSTGEAGKSAFDELKDAARSVRELADNLNERTAVITAGLAQFTGSGLREYEGLAVEARKAISEINRTVRSIERNPQQFIFGGRPSMPQYNGNR